MKMISKLAVVGLAAVALLTSAAAQTFTWGDNSLHQRDLPVGFVSAAHVSAGYGFAVACFADGTVKAWGTNAQGKTTVPAGLNHVVQVGAGKQFAAALKDDGTVVTWGGNDFGQQNKPEGLSGVKQISLGDRHAVALKTDGTLVAWGGNTYHQTEVPEGLSGVTQVAAGGFFTIALKSDGTVVCFGDNTYHECEPPADLTGVKQVAAGRYFGMALKTNGNVVCWGNNDRGQCTPPGSVVNVTQIAAGDAFALALKSEGKTITGWGDNALGQTVTPSDTGYIGQIAAGVGFAMAVAKPRVSFNLTGIYGGGTDLLKFTVDLGHPAPANTVINLATTDPKIGMRPQITIKAGNSSSIISVTHQIVETTRTVYGLASYSGGSPAAAALLVNKISLRIKVDSPGIESGDVAPAHLVITHRVPRGTKVLISCDRPDLMSYPDAVIVDRSLAPTFEVRSILPVVVPTPVNFFAHFEGSTDVVSGNAVVVPGVEMTDFTLSSSTLYEGEEPTVTVTLANAAPAGGSVIELNTDFPGYPTRFVVPGGKNTASNTLRGFYLTSDTARLGSLSASHFGKTISRDFTLNPVHMTGITLSANEVVGGSAANVLATVTLDRVIKNAPFFPTSSNPLAAEVAEQIWSEGLKPKLTFRVKHKLVTGPQTVTISLTRNGVTVSTTLLVKP